MWLCVKLWRPTSLPQWLTWPREVRVLLKRQTDQQIKTNVTNGYNIFTSTKDRTLLISATKIYSHKVLYVLSFREYVTKWRSLFTGQEASTVSDKDPVKAIVMSQCLSFYSRVRLKKINKWLVIYLCFWKRYILIPPKRQKNIFIYRYIFKQLHYLIHTDVYIVKSVMPLLYQFRDQAKNQQVFIHFI